ncbi:MAG: hypothetical protein E6H46_09870, partial [Betaproteobacteria bacterium]
MLAVAGLVNAQPKAAEPVLPAAPPLVVPAARVEELLLLVDVNAQGLADTVLVLRDVDGRIAVPVDSLDRWRLR